MLFTLLIYALIGLCAGFLSGLLGIGGGLVVVPTLLLTFHLLGFPEAHAMQIAVGTSLGAMIFTAASSAWAHYRQKGVWWHYFRLLAPGVVVGAITGALLADYLTSQKLILIFGISVIAIGGYFLLPLKQREDNKPYFPHFLMQNAIGIFIGGLSSILGIGGGIITVPVLTAMHIPLRNAISTSAVVGFLIAVVGALSFLLLGMKHQLMAGSVGYLYLPAFFGIAITSTLAAPYGAKCTYIWPTDLLRHIFGAGLIIAGILMIK